MDPEEIAKPEKKAPSSSDKLYREAYEDGIRTAAPGQSFCVVGQKVSAVIGGAASQHAKGPTGEALTGPGLIAWIREKAREFRVATVERPELWGGWQPYAWARWLNMGERSPVSAKPSMLQPMPAGGLKVKSVRLGDLK